MNNNIIVFNTVTAGGGQCSTSNGLTVISGSTNGATATFRQNSLLSARASARVASVAQVTVATPTATNNAVYTLVIESFNKITGTPQDFAYTYISDASATRLEIVNAFVSQINADSRIPVVASQTGSNPNETLTLTAQAPYYIFTAKNGNPNATTITFSTSTPGVVGQGTGSEVLAGPYADASIEAGSNYTGFYFTHEKKSPLDADSLKKETESVVVWVKEGVTNFDDLAKLSATKGTLTVALGL